MSEYFGPGVSRTLSALQRQFGAVVWQKGRPPLDSELSLIAQIADENLRQAVRAQVHSGFLLDPTRSPADYVTAPQWSNFFLLGRQADGEEAPVVFANVNGWIIPVSGTGVSTGDTANKIRLNPPPASDARIDLVFLEAWATLVAPNPSEANKPSASTLFRWGNVEFGGTNITDDLEDPNIGFETTERVQVQYRLRVFGEGAGLGSSVALDVYPDGLDDPNVLARGTSATPVAGMTFTNMREELGDPSLWRAGDGDPTNDLGTVDGYVYAIPVAAVFRRNSSPFEAVEPAGAANQNGGFDRNPSAASLPEPRDGAKVLSVPTLTNAISESATGVIAVTGLANSGFDDPSIGTVFVVLDGEVVGPLTAIGATTVTVGATGRGRNGTQAVPHAAGTSVRFFNARPDGLFADQVASGDVLDLRRGVTLGDWDYQRLLIHNLAKLVQGNLRTSYKQSAVGDTEGVQVVEVGYLLADGATAVPPSTVAVDGPDGVRTVFSDAASLQSDVTVLCDEVAAAGAVASLDAGVEWDVAADFRPSGFISAAGYSNGTVVRLSIGGANGSTGARGTFRAAGTQAVRFVAPFEFWKTDIAADDTTGNQAPVKVRWLEEGALQPAAYGETASLHPGPMYPQRSSNFEAPFMVLGGVLNGATPVGAVTLHNASPAAGQFSIRLPGLDFDAAGGWYPPGDLTSLSPSGIANPVLRGQRTLFDMLTRGGTDRTGLSSEVYLVLTGDSANPANCGAFQVIGAGTVGYTEADASAADRVRIRFVSAGVSAFVATGASITAEMRSQHTNAEDGPGGSSSGAASLVLVFTDLAGTRAGSKWPSLVAPPISGQKMVISTSLLYHPGRGATARVADSVWRVAGRNLGAEYLRESPATRDATFPSQAGTPGDETYFDVQHVQSWNRLTSLGMSAPDAPGYGGAVQAFSEQSREAEAFIDRGSKTLVFRPFLDRSMTLQARTSAAAVGDTLLGPAAYPGPTPPVATPKDGAAIWTSGLHMGFEVPPEFMPRFGRQDIPYHRGNGTFLPGVNHLFTDSTDVNEAQSYVIGGQDSTNATIRPIYVQTGATSGLDYGQYGTIVGPSTPAYQGRLYSSEAVISSDLGRGMKGIQLPPYVGVARLYGVYDMRDYVAKGGATFNSDRVTPAADPATNLLRTDATKQTLFILQGGAEDATGDADDHTYIVPEDAVDIRLSPTYVDGEAFDDIEYVVEFCCFGYSRGFINKNNYVLARRHKGTVTVIADGDDPEAEGARMTIPSPAPSDAVYVGFTRTPYQGDPYMTRAGETRTVTDYESRYGQIGVADQFKLTSSIQQFDSSGDLVPETPNRRAVQVLAALDFHTTLGTGKIGGQLYHGTPLDCGYTENTEGASSRLPPTNTSPAWRVLTRAFSEGQRLNTSHASLGIEVANNAILASQAITFTIPNASAVTLTAGVDFAVGANAAVTASNLAAAIAANATLGVYVDAKSANTTIATVTALEAGASGNGINVSVAGTAGAIDLLTPRTADAASVTSANLSGGLDLHVNGGVGTSQLDLTGMTERLPLGILLQDSDFICENPLLDNSSALSTSPPGIQPVQSLLPLAEGGQEYTRFLGGPGQWVGLADGGILRYEAYDAVSAPTGTTRFRLFRGGGSAFVLSDPVPGGPIDWVSGSFPQNLQPVLKGGVLVCKALLVRNLHEEAFTVDATTTQGDEVQMVVLTYGILGHDTQEEGVSLSGVVGPTGFGEGYAAADRYRLEGRPMSVGRARSLTTIDADPAVYPGTGADPTMNQG